MPAMVKVIKCLVENLVVDISFSQLGGLCTLCFLDEIDHLINHDHLFKRSVILIKAWCFFESRILGAHHGLISTYALEVLVMYIFHVFNNCFAGPMEVLFLFLEFFSNFDWDNFCVSLWGPVRITSLPDMTAEPPRNDRGKLLLSNIVLDACSSVFAAFPSGNQNRPFVSKHFNVIDPLRTNNNLGRSVSKGNFCRIRSAFAFGAGRLAMMLECPNENIIPEIDQFFVNLLKLHGSHVRPDAPLHDLQLRTLINRYENGCQAGGKKRDKITSGSQAEKSAYSNDTAFIPAEDVDHSYDNTSIGFRRRYCALTSATENSSANRKETNSCDYGQDAGSSDALRTEHTTSFSSVRMPGEHAYKGIPTAGVELACETSFVHQKVQNRISNLASSRLYCDLHVPFNSVSYIPDPLSSSFSASMGYGQRELRGLISSNDCLVDYPTFFNGQPLPSGVSSSHVLPCAPTAGMAPKPVETLKFGCDNPGQDSRYYGAIDSSNLAGQNSRYFDAAVSLDQSKVFSRLSDKFSLDCHMEERRKPDILNSDIASHWLNLQFGRFCLSQHEACSLSDSFPHKFSTSEDHGRSISSANAYLSAQMMGYWPHLFAASLQAGSDRNASWVYQQYEDESIKCGGIGMSLPDHATSERNRAAKRFSSRHSHDVDFKNESVSYNSAHSLHGYSSVNSNAIVSPAPDASPAVMYCPYEPIVGGCTSSLGQFKFGSFVSVPFSDGYVGP